MANPCPAERSEGEASRCPARQILPCTQDDTKSALAGCSAIQIKKVNSIMMNEQQEHLQAMVKTYRPIEQLTPAHWSASDLFANGIHQHSYRTGSERPPLLLLHGFNEYRLTWLRTACELAQDYDIILLDARGHGLSSARRTTSSSRSPLQAKQPNISIVYFEQTGHLIRRIAFEQYMSLVREFLSKA